MSYCRFSSDNWMSDVYVYADVDGGWTTHVAGKRTTKEPPTVPDIRECTKEEWREAYKRQSEWLDTEAKYEDIGFPYDGVIFNHDTPGECADWLEELRKLGYRVPQHAIDALREKQAEEDN